MLSEDAITRNNIYYTDSVNMPYSDLSHLIHTMVKMKYAVYNGLSEHGIINMIMYCLKLHTPAGFHTH